MHPADGGGPLIDGVRLCGIVVLALAPGASCRYLALQALPGALRAAVECQEGAQLVLVDARVDVAYDVCLLAAQGVLGKPRAGIEVARRVDGEHSARPTPVLVVLLRVERLADVLAEEGAGIVLVVPPVDNLVRQLRQLRFKQLVVALLPHVLEHAVDVHLVDAQAVQVQHALLDVGQVRATDGHLGGRVGKLLQPQRNVAHHVIVRAPPVALVHPVQVMLLPGAVYGDANAQVAVVLLDEALHLLLVVVDAVGGEAEAVGVEPMVPPAEHLCLQVVADAVYQVYLDKWLPAYEVENDGFFRKLLLPLQYVVYGRLGHLPRHAFLRVLAHQVAILAGQLAVLGDDEGDVLRLAGLPGAGFFIVNAFHRYLKIGST